MSVEIYVNDSKIDLEGDEDIVQTFAINSFGDVASRNSAYSNNFKAPITANNRSILENADIVLNSSTLPYQAIPCKIYVDSIVVVPGFAEITSCSDTYQIRVYAGNFDFYSQIKGLKISDLDLSDLNHNWTLANIAASRTNTEGYIYGIIDYHTDSPNAFIDNSTRQINVTKLLFSVYHHTLIDRIVSEAGFTMSGNLLSNEDYLSLALPFTNDDLLRLTEPFLYKAGTTQQQSFLFDGNGTITSQLSIFDDDTSEGFFDNDNHWNTSTYRYVADQAISISFSVTVNVESFISNTFMNVRIFKNGVQQQSIQTLNANGTHTVNFSELTLAASDYVDFEYAPAFTDTGFKHTITSVVNSGGNAQLLISGSFSFTIGETYYVDASPYVGDFVILDTGAGYATIDTPYSSTATGLIWDFELNKELVRVNAEDTVSFNAVDENVDFNTGIDVAFNLPKMNQADLLKAILQKFGAIIQVNNSTKEIQIRQFSEIVDNIPNAYDWSDKLDETEKTELAFKFDKYSQINNCTYKDDESVLKPEGTDYELLINNKNLNGEGDLFKSPFAASQQVDRLEDLSIVQIKKYTAGVLSGKTQPRIIYIRKVDLTDGDLTYSDGVGTVVTGTSIPLTHFILEGQSFNLGWEDNLIPEQSSEIEDVLQNTKVIKELIRLNSSDINQLDLFRPVWLEKHGCYFYISEVSQYKMNKVESTIVELVKLT